MQQQCKQNMEVACYVLLYHVFLQIPPRHFCFIPSSRHLPVHLAHCPGDMPSSEKIERTRKKERIMVSLGSQRSVLELPIFIFQSIYQFFFLLRPLPHPQRLAPVVILRLAVGFMQALAGAPRMPSWRGDLVRPSMWGSMEVCGG